MFSDLGKVPAMLAACGMLLVGLPSAQGQIASEGMDDISAWGERYLSSSEPDFPSNLWSNSTPEILLPLLQSMDTGTLTPTERSLLRRIILSPAQPITGPEADLLLTERARLMLDLGEAEAAAALAPRLEQAALGLEAEALAVDLDLARGKNASACARLEQPVSDRLYWLQLRAVCAVLRDNFAGAALAIEVASTNGLDDDWFIEAVFGAAGATMSAPPARFDSGLSIALSLEADLDPSALDPGTIRTDLAAALAERPDLEPDLRLHFADRAYEAGLLPPEQLRALIDARVAQADLTSETDRDRVFKHLLDPLTTDLQRARLLSDYLTASGQAGLNSFVRAADLVAPDLAALPRNDQTSMFVPVFARSALALGDPAGAQAWLDLAYGPPEPPPVTQAPQVLSPEPEPVQVPPPAADPNPEEEVVLVELMPADAGGPAPVAPNPADMMLAAALEADAARQAAPVAPAADIPPIMGDLHRLDKMLAPPPDPEPFLLALIETLALFEDSRLTPSDHSDLTGRLIRTAVTDSDFEQVTLLLNLMPAFGFRLDADARDFLITQPVLGIPVDEHIALAIQTATDDLAFAEATLMMLTQTRSSPSTLSPRDLGHFVRALRDMQAHDIAAGFAREASGFWIVPDGAIPDLPPDVLSNPVEPLIEESEEVSEPQEPSDPVEPLADL